MNRNFSSDESDQIVVVQALFVRSWEVATEADQVTRFFEIG